MMEVVSFRVCSETNLIMNFEIQIHISFGLDTNFTVVYQLKCLS